MSALPSWFTHRGTNTRSARPARAPSRPGATRRVGPSRHWARGNRLPGPLSRHSAREAAARRAKALRMEGKSRGNREMIEHLGGLRKVPAIPQAWARAWSALFNQLMNLALYGNMDFECGGPFGGVAPRQTTCGDVISYGVAGNPGVPVGTELGSFLVELPSLLPTRRDYLVAGKWAKPDGWPGGSTVPVVPYWLPFEAIPPQTNNWRWEHLPNYFTSEVTPGVRWDVSPDPFMNPARYPHYRMVPNIRTNPFRVPGYRTEIGPNPGDDPHGGDEPGVDTPPVRPPRPRGVQVPGLNSRGNPRPPAPGEREGKGTVTKAMIRVLDAFGAMTEVEDMIDAFWKSLPKDIRMAMYRRFGTSSLNSYQKFQAIYDHFGSVNLGQALARAIYGQVEDRLIARISNWAELPLRQRMDYVQRYLYRRGSGDVANWLSRHPDWLK